MRKTQTKNPQSWSLGLLIMFLSLVLLIIYLLFFSNDSTYKTPILNQVEPQENTNSAGKQELQWELYINEELGFEMSIPKYLYKTEITDQGGFKSFIRFEQTNFSLEKGIAVGVSEKSFEEETKTLKESLLEDGAKLQSEDKIFISELEGLKITFVPEEGSEGESRSIVIVTKDSLTYSISTVPEQIDRVVESFRFL